jgi:transposase
MPPIQSKICSETAKHQSQEIVNKPKYRKYLTNVILAECGHCVLRLPPYRPDLNPMELTWADVKQSITGKNTTFKVRDVE